MQPFKAIALLLFLTTSLSPLNAVEKAWCANQTPGGVSKECTFTNRAPVSIIIEWCDSSATAREYMRLEPGKTWVVNSYVNHRWGFLSAVNLALLQQYDVPAYSTCSITVATAPAGPVRNDYPEGDINNGLPTNPYVPAKRSSSYASGKGRETKIIYVPVYFHILQDGQWNVTNETATSQLQVLNRVFNTSTMQVMFELKAIYYHTLNVTQQQDSRQFNLFDDMRRNMRKGGEGSAEELHVFVRSSYTGFRGLSSFPWNFAQDPCGDNLVVSYDQLIGSPLPGFSKGFYIVHEVGHWLGLYHTFEKTFDVLSNQTVGDGVNDTPYQASESIDCSNADSNITAPFNFMDYAGDDCTGNFTPGQMDRAFDIYVEYRSNKSVKCSPPSLDPKLLPGPRSLRLYNAPCGFVRLPPFTIGGNMTVESWVKFNRNYGASNPLFEFTNKFIGDNIFIRTYDREPLLHAGVLLGNFGNPLVGIYPVEFGTSRWVHVALKIESDGGTRDGKPTAQIRPYINGEPQYPVRQWLPMTLLRRNNVIGGNLEQPNSSMDINIQEFRIWTEARTDEQIKATMNTRLDDCAYPTLFARYGLDQSTGNIAYETCHRVPDTAILGGSAAWDGPSGSVSPQPMPTPAVPLFVGCFKDTYPPRAMKGFAYNPNMTVDFCALLASELNFRFFALQTGNQCWFSNSYTELSRYGASNNCSLVCPGNTSQICGGNWANSVYELPTGILQPVEILGPSDTLVSSHVGCFVATKNSTASMKFIFYDSNMNAELCASAADFNNYRYFGLRDSFNCWGSNNLTEISGFGPSTECIFPCFGTMGAMCGGLNANLVFEIKKTCKEASCNNKALPCCGIDNICSTSLSGCQPSKSYRAS